MFSTERRSSLLVIPLLAGLFCNAAIAADKDNKDKKMDAKGTEETVTGCLAKGDGANEYSIKGDNGKTYGLVSSKVKLGDHLNHKVTVTGKVTKAPGGGKEAKAGEESEHLRVTNLTMVSTSCP